jgi:hypothetical protein
VSGSQAVHVAHYLESAGIPLKAVRGGSFVTGSPLHLAALVELAMADLGKLRG